MPNAAGKFNVLLLMQVGILRKVLCTSARRCWPVSMLVDNAIQSPRLVSVIVSDWCSIGLNTVTSCQCIAKRSDENHIVINRLRTNSRCPTKLSKADDWMS